MNELKPYSKAQDLSLQQIIFLQINTILTENYTDYQLAINENLIFAIRAAQHNCMGSLPHHRNPRCYFLCLRGDVFDFFV